VSGRSASSVVVKRAVVERDVIANRANNRRYLAMRGMLDDVGGRILETSRRKTTSARRIEIEND